MPKQVCSFCSFLVCFGVAAHTGFGQLTTELKPNTAKKFDSYVAQAEAQLAQQWKRKAGPLAIDERPQARLKVLRGEQDIVAGTEESPVTIPDGLIHDWVGDVFLPSVTPEQVKGALLDFNRHHEFYPDVIRSRTEHVTGDTVTGYWRLKKDSGVLGAVLDVTTETTCRTPSNGTLVCQSRATQIVEVKDAGTAKEERLPPGKDQGFLWRMAATWTLEPVNGGVLAECRTISLSRDVPFGLSFAVKPFLKHIPVEEMTTTLHGIKSALRR